MQRYGAFRRYRTITPRLRPLSFVMASRSESLAIGKPFNSIVQGGPLTTTISGALGVAASINSPIILPHYVVSGHLELMMRIRQP
jgi:hypothetical protein